MFLKEKEKEGQKEGEKKGEKAKINRVYCMISVFIAK